MTSELAMNVFDGTQSVSTQAPPGPSASTRVTSASSWAATKAASYPPGPPPMITIRLTTFPSVTTRLCRHALFYSPPRRYRAIVIAVRHYAAYGSNLDPARMRAYCPHSPMVGVGWIEGWRLTFAGEGEMGWEGAVTTIVESPGDRVFVSLYDVHPWDAAQLDEVEGVTAGAYQKLTVRVETLDGEVSVWVYVFDGYEGGMPTAWYLSEIANAAEKAGAPDDYVSELRGRPTRTASPEL